MQLTLVQTRTTSAVDEFLEQLAEVSLLHYATEAASEMEFDSLDELQESVKRAMELCISAGISVKGNFRRVYKSSADGMLYDWKLSPLAYRLVCLNGSSSNPAVAKFTVQLIKNEHINHEEP